MKNPRSDPAPGASSSRGSGGEAFAGTTGRDVAGGDKTSAWTGEKKTKFQATPTSMDLDNDETARRDDSEEADKVVHAIDHERLGQIEGLDWDDTMLKEDLDSFMKRYKGLPHPDDEEAWAPMDDQQLKDMEIRFALCRIKFQKMLKGDEAVTDADLRKMYPPDKLEENGYFEWLEHDFEWYFDTEYLSCARLEDYQRLALHNTGLFLHWEYYHNTCSTLQSDQQFVYFWETLSSKTEWFKKIQTTNSSEQKKIERVVFYHAVKLANECTHVFTPLLHSAYSEYLWSVDFDMTWYEDFACLYFEIWKLVTKHKMSFKDALHQVKEKGMSSMCRFDLEAEFDSDRQWPGPITHNYNTYMAEIDEHLPDDEAYKLIMEAVKKFVTKRISYYDYAKKKLDIAEKIGLIPPSPLES